MILLMILVINEEKSIFLVLPSNSWVSKFLGSYIFFIHCKLEIVGLFLEKVYQLWDRFDRYFQKAHEYLFAVVAVGTYIFEM